jgi:hypothetical protein
MVVPRALDVHKSLAPPKRALQRQIDAADRQACPDAGDIDQLVRQLYGLTDEEIRIVEEATRQ